MPGPIGPPGHNGSQGSAGPAGSTGPPGPKGAGDFSACQYKTKESILVPGGDLRISVGYTEPNASIDLLQALISMFLDHKPLPKHELSSLPQSIDSLCR